MNVHPWDSHSLVFLVAAAWGGNAGASKTLLTIYADCIQEGERPPRIVELYLADSLQKIADSTASPADALGLLSAGGPIDPKLIIGVRMESYIQEHGMTQREAAQELLRKMRGKYLGDKNERTYRNYYKSWLRFRDAHEQHLSGLQAGRIPDPEDLETCSKYFPALAHIGEAFQMVYLDLEYRVGLLANRSNPNESHPN